MPQTWTMRISTTTTNLFDDTIYTQQENMAKMKNTPIAIVAALITLGGCATLTNDANVPVAFSMSDGSNANCNMTNKRGIWEVDVPTTAMIRRSDDALKYNCTTEDGRTAVGSIPSTVGAKIVASAVFIDFGITDAITDKHREYPPSYVIPIKKVDSPKTEQPQ